MAAVYRSCLHELQSSDMISVLAPFDDSPSEANEYRQKTTSFWTWQYDLQFSTITDRLVIHTE